MRIGVWTLSTLLFLGLAACSDADEPEPDATSEPTPTTSSIPPGPGDAFDPCTLIPREQIEQAGLYAAETGDQFVGLSLGNEQVVDCRVDAQETFTFGYKGVDDGREVWRLVGLSGPDENPELQPIDGLGDEAYYTGDSDRDQRLVIRVGEEQLFLRDSTASGVSLEVLTELGRTMVDNLPATFDHEPILLPNACPSADDPAVSELIGDVIQARGAEMTNDRVDLLCRYLGAGETRISAQVMALTPGNADSLLNDRAERSEEIEAEGRAVFIDDSTADTSISVAAADDDGTYYSINVSALVGGEDYDSDRSPGRDPAVQFLLMLTGD